ncbi:DUF1328 domain-containing protein [Croceibacterium xixiisoli]
MPDAIGEGAALPLTNIQGHDLCRIVTLRGRTISPEHCRYLPVVMPELVENLDTAHYRGGRMFRWAIIFAVVALIAALLGFGGVAGLSADLAKIFLVVAAVILVVGFFFGRGSRVP